MFFKLWGNHHGANPSLYKNYGQELLMWAGVIWKRKIVFAKFRHKRAQKNDEIIHLLIANGMFWKRVLGYNSHTEPPTVKKTCTHIFTGVCCIFWHRPRPFASIIFFRKIAKNAKQFFPYSSHISWPIDTKLCTRYLQTHTQRMHETLFWCDLWRRNGSVLNIGLLAKLDVEYQKSKEIQN